MHASIRGLVEAALKLPPEARGALASRLIDSLQGDEVDADAEVAWDAEIARRVNEVDAGRVETVPWSDARQQILRAK
jgi:putative addiction module component (TIGR02574 family)